MVRAIKTRSKTKKETRIRNKTVKGTDYATALADVTCINTIGMAKMESVSPNMVVMVMAIITNGGTDTRIR
jgi:hypothetical protein